MTRLDVALVLRNLVKSRQRAKDLIKRQCVKVNDRSVVKPAFQVSADDVLTVVDSVHPYVGRGGLKLQKALSEFAVDVTGFTCLDVGASTGGFTDCLLKNGALKVFALDVGHDQLDCALRSDARVVNMEGVNIRRVKASDFGEQLDLITVDVAFISTTHVLPVIAQLFTAQTLAIVLLKPQFEVGRAGVGKNGVVKDHEQHFKALKNFIKTCEIERLVVRKIDFSGIKGSRGNIEYITLIDGNQDATTFWRDADIRKIVTQSHNSLNR